MTEDDLRFIEGYATACDDVVRNITGLGKLRNTSYNSNNREKVCNLILKETIEILQEDLLRRTGFKWSTYLDWPTGE